MKAALFGLIVTAILILVSYGAMTAQPDATFMMDFNHSGDTTMPAPARFHPFVGNDNGPWL